MGFKILSRRQLRETILTHTHTFYELQNIVKKTVEGNNSYTHSHREANHAGDQLAKNSVNPT